MYFSDCTGGYCLVADCLFTQSVGGMGWGNPLQASPQVTNTAAVTGYGFSGAGEPYGYGYYAFGVIVERCSFGNIGVNTYSIPPGGVIAFNAGTLITVRDCYAWVFLANFFTGQDGTGIAGSNASFLQSCIYRNKIYKDTSLDPNDTGAVIRYFVNSQCTLQQEFTDNIIWDGRGASYVQVIWSVWADQISAKSVIDRNSYYCPNQADYMWSFSASYNDSFAQEPFSAWSTASGTLYFDQHGQNLASAPGSIPTNGDFSSWITPL
jgi:hypothetical protein